MIGACWQRRRKLWSDPQKSADLRNLLREIQVACGALERELRALKEEMTRKDSELVKRQEDLRISELQARNANAGGSWLAGGRARQLWFKAAAPSPG